MWSHHTHTRHHDHTHSIACDHNTHTHTHSIMCSHLNHDHMHWCRCILCDDTHFVYYVCLVNAGVYCVTDAHFVYYIYSVICVILMSDLFFHCHQVAGSVVWAGPVKMLHQWCSRMWLLVWEGKRWLIDSTIAVHTTSLGPVCCRENQTALLWVMIYQILNWFGQHLRISLITILSQTSLFR